MRIFMSILRMIPFLEACKEMKIKIKELKSRNLEPSVPLLEINFKEDHLEVSY